MKPEDDESIHNPPPPDQAPPNPTPSHVRTLLFPHIEIAHSNLLYNFLIFSE